MVTAEQPAKGEALETAALFLSGAFPTEHKKKIEIEKNGLKGYEISVERRGPDPKKKLVGKVRVFYAAGRVYMLTANKPDGGGTDNLDKFLDSFRITKLKD